MATPFTNHEIEVDGLRVPLRQPVVAAILAWLIPGAGHYYQGRTGKAALYGSTILMLFVIGMVLSGGKAVYWSWSNEDWRLQYLCQVGVGVPAMPALLQAYMDPSGAKRYPDPNWRNFQKKPSSTAQLDEWHRSTSSGFDLGTLYTMVAGLLNILVVLDAFGGPLPMLGHDSRGKVKKDRKPPLSDPPAESASKPQASGGQASSGQVP